MKPLVLRYAEDMTGINPNNLVQGEEHNTVNTRVRAIAPLHGPFYSESVILRDAVTQQIFTRDLDYFCVEYYETPSLKSGKEVCAIILITNEDIATNQFTIDYQVVGGEFSYSYDAIAELVNKVMDDTRPVNWPNILNIPPRFQPAPHRHDAGDTFGWEYVVAQLEQIRRAILVGDSASHDEIYRYIDYRIDVEVKGMLDAIEALLNDHINDKGNPHQVTKAQVGLGNLPNQKSDSRDFNESESLATSKAMYDHKRSGDHDDRYVQHDPSNPISFYIDAGRLFATFSGMSVQVWPPQWQ